MLEHRVGGIILCTVSDISLETIERIKKVNISLITAVREIPSLMCDYVGIDYSAGTHLAVKHLIEKRHRS